MHTETPFRIAVIIPVYNVTSFLEETLRSAVTQDYPHKEIIVVDDGSAHGAAEDIKRVCSLFSDVTLLHQEHSGAAAARDAGVAHSSSELIYFLDADDVLLPGALRFFAGVMEKNPEATAAYAKAMEIDEHGNPLSGSLYPDFAESGRDLLLTLLKRGFLYNGAICVRKSALQQCKPNHYHLQHGEDWVLWCHLALSGNIIAAGKRAVLHYRKHKQNATASMLENISSVFEAYDIVYMDAKFITAVGKEELETMRKRRLSTTHMRFASMYASQANLQQAHFHLSKVEISPSLLGLSSRRRSASTVD